MSGTLIARAVVCIVLTTFATTLGQTWKELLGAANSLSQTQQYDSAIVLYDLALAEAQDRFGYEDTATARVLSWMGVNYNFKKDYAAAEETIKEVLALRERLLGANHPDVAQTLYNLEEHMSAWNDTKKLLRHTRGLWQSENECWVTRI